MPDRPGHEAADSARDFAPAPDPAGTDPGARGPSGRGPAPGPGPLEAGAARALAGSLNLVIIPVIFLVLAAAGAFAYGAAVFVHALTTIVSHPFPVGHQIGLFLLDIDLFLIGATLLLAAVGLYELFVREIRFDERVSMPAWLEMHDLNDLKARVIAMIVMVLAVSFVEMAVDASNGREVLELGGGIAAVIIALTAFLKLTGHGAD
jgi:uncharacterized protein (TIGR00645 family)